LEFVFVDPSKPSVRIAQSECERIDGKTEARVVVINGRDMDALEGELSLACARYKLEGKATYQGCLP
jgi:hypothetical protein